MIQRLALSTQQQTNVHTNKTNCVGINKPKLNKEHEVCYQKGKLFFFLKENVVEIFTNFLVALVFFFGFSKMNLNSLFKVLIY